MGSSAVVADVFGTLGAVCWSIQLIPQIWQNYRLQSTEGLQPTMMLLWSSAGIPLGIYNIIRAFPIALQIQPQILTFLSLLTWIQTQYYPPARDVKPRSVSWCTAVLASACAVAGGIEVGVIFGIRTATDRMAEADIEYYWPVVLMGALSAVLLCAGVGRHYVDIWREKTVRGISFLFVGIDALGDLTSLISVLFWWKAGRSLDILGLVVYGSELVLWLGVFACAGVLNLYPWLRQRLDERRSSRRQHIGAEANEATNSDRHTDESTRTEPVQRMSSPSASTTSRSTNMSGTVFRTASGQHREDVAREADLEEMRHEHMRLRNVVHLSV